MNPVELEHLDKRFGEHVVFRDLALSVQRGETLAVVGPSGVGKSVLLKLIMGLYRPDRGRVQVEGVEVSRLGERDLRKLRRKIGMLFQGAALFDSLTVGENIAYGLREHYQWAEEKIARRVAECLAQVGLPGVEQLLPAALSGGMKKRVGLARALAPGPEVILYDEPTTGLDPANARRINELIRSLQQQLHVTSLVITHDMESVFAVADRVALIAGQRVALSCSVDEAHRAPELRAFMQGEEAPL